MVETLVVIDAPHFYAGLVAREGRVIEAAPIIHYMKQGRWTGQQVADYCVKRGWTWEVVSTTSW